MADVTWPSSRGAMPGTVRAGYPFESGSLPSQRQRVRSASMSYGMPPPRTLANWAAVAAVKSKLDPNSKPFSPRQSPRKGQGSDAGEREIDVGWCRSTSNASNDSGCQSYEEKASVDGSPVYPSGKSPVGMKSTTEFKLRSGAEKLEDDKKMRMLWAQSGGTFIHPHAPSSSPSAVPAKNLSSGGPSKRLADDLAEDSDSVFFPSGSKIRHGMLSASVAENPQEAKDVPLLPTPEDFPPFGPVTRTPSVIDAIDEFGLRSLVKAINQTAAQMEYDREGCSVVSLEDLGFTQGFLQNCNGRTHQYLGSPFNNRVVTPLADCHYVPPEYFHSNITTKTGKLSDVDLRRAPSDILFFLFYVAVEDIWQHNAAYELFKRGWRYHKVMGVWLGFLPDKCAEERTSTYERGKYQFFNVRTWSRDVAEFTIFYKDVAGMGLAQQYNQVAARQPRQEYDSGYAAKVQAMMYQPQPPPPPRSAPSVKALIEQRQAAMARAMMSQECGGGGCFNSHDHLPKY